MDILNDIRNRQIFIVALLCLFASRLSSSFIDISHFFLVISFALLNQYAFSKYFFGSLRKDWWKSSLITSMSIMLLMRTSSPIYYYMAVTLGIGGKFFIKDKSGKHFLNPSNMAIVLLLLFTENIWIDYGYWGKEFLFLLLPVLLFGLVGRDPQIYQVSFKFLLCFGSMALLRHLYIGDPFRIFVHQYLSVSLFVFALFMISDPRTTPNHKLGKWFFCFMVSLSTVIWNGFLYKRNGLFLSLFAISLLTPIINIMFKEESFQWKKEKSLLV